MSLVQLLSQVVVVDLDHQLVELTLEELDLEFQLERLEADHRDTADVVDFQLDEVDYQLEQLAADHMDTVDGVDTVLVPCKVDLVAFVLGDILVQDRVNNPSEVAH